MKAKATTFSIALITLTLVFGLNAFCDEIYSSPKENVYGHMLDNYIARCDAKIWMTNSSLKNVRRAAAMAILKGTFVKAYRQELINGLAEDGIDQKSYKVDLYLNKRFYGLVR